MSNTILRHNRSCRALQRGRLCRLLPTISHAVGGVQNLFVANPPSRLLRSQMSAAPLNKVLTFIVTTRVARLNGEKEDNGRFPTQTISLSHNPLLANSRKTARPIGPEKSLRCFGERNVGGRLSRAGKPCRRRKKQSAPTTHKRISSFCNAALT
jgi:hypothetical protein